MREDLIEERGGLNSKRSPKARRARPSRVTRTASESAAARSRAICRPVSRAGALYGGGPGGACSVGYRVVGEWGGGFQGEIALRNTGAAPVSGWNACAIGQALASK